MRNLTAPSGVVWSIGSRDWEIIFCLLADWGDDIQRRGAAQPVWLGASIIRTMFVMFHFAIGVSVTNALTPLAMN